MHRRVGPRSSRGRVVTMTIDLDDFPRLHRGCGAVVAGTHALETVGEGADQMAATAVAEAVGGTVEADGVLGCVHVLRGGDFDRHGFPDAVCTTARRAGQLDRFQWRLFTLGVRAECDVHRS